MREKDKGVYYICDGFSCQKCGASSKKISQAGRKDYFPLKVKLHRRDSLPPVPQWGIFYISK